MGEEISNPLLSLVKEQGLIDDLQYEEVAGEVKRSGTPVFQALQNFGIMDADAILQAMANHLGTEVVQLKNVDLPKDALSAVPANTAKMYRCLPVGFSDGMLRVAFEDPLDPQRVDELAFVAKREVQVVVAHPAEIQAGLDKFYGEEVGGDVAEILKELGGDEKIAEESIVATETDDETLIAGLANEAPIVRFVNLVLFQAVKDRASDIHFEPFETEFRIRYRVDGALYEMSPPPKHLALPVVSRIKVMANLNIS
jgi:type IV pilus assembly protein PilB